MFVKGSKMHFDDMVLYYKPTCPYCVKVLTFMEVYGINMEMRDTYDPANLDELLRINGRSQVPCLVIDGKPMLESDDIIAYLRSRVEAH